MRNRRTAELWAGRWWSPWLRDNDGVPDRHGGDRSDPPKRGGTLRVMVAAKPAHFDPQRVQTATEANLSRLITRTLTTYRSGTNSGETEIIGDLATDAGRPSEGNQVGSSPSNPG